MGLTYANLRLRNPVQPDLMGIDVRALADTGTLHLCIPQDLALQLNLKELEQREVTLASGQKQLVSYVGPIEIGFANRRCFVGAMVLGDEALLGAIPMEDMDLVVMPSFQEVQVNPASPNIPTSVEKGMKGKPVGA